MKQDQIYNFQNKNEIIKLQEENRNNEIGFFNKMENGCSWENSYYKKQQEQIIKLLNFVCNKLQNINESFEVEKLEGINVINLNQEIENNQNRINELKITINKFELKNCKPDFNSKYNIPDLLLSDIKNIKYCCKWFLSQN